jgi:hypothetical protein
MTSSSPSRLFPVMPAKAGIQGQHTLTPSRDSWIPAFAGMTGEVRAAVETA